MSRRVFQLPGRARRDGQVPVAGALLTGQEQKLIEDELALLERLSDVLARYPAAEEDQSAVKRAAEHLIALFLLVIVGEFNAGKSAFINALIGAPVMPEGVTPTTSVINLLRHGEVESETMLPEGVIQRTFPAPFLEEITVVDTPGTNAIIREHEALTQRFVPRADRPFSESEREFMTQIREWGKKIVVIINKIDMMRDDTSKNEVIEFV